MHVMSEEKKIRYMDILSEELAEYYNMSLEKAMDVVRNSFVNKMLVDDDDAVWQMHQPLESTVDEIFCEYKGLPVTI
jgi:hypothetical protein